MGSEIERKFLCSPSAEVLAVGGTAIWQGYLTIGRDSETRLRRAGERFWLTTKRGKGLVRSEWEVELTEGQFDAVWPGTEGLRLTKTRYEMPLDAGDCVVDLYSGQLDGLRVAEVDSIVSRRPRGLRHLPGSGRRSPESRSTRISGWPR